MNSDLGKKGERIAARFLRRKGLRLVESNFRQRYGEIDLVCRAGHCVVFVEVKTRSNLKFGYPEEAITPQKKEHILHTALFYLKKNGLLEQNYRFDLVTILFNEKGKLEKINHLVNFLEEEYAK